MIIPNSMEVQCQSDLTVIVHADQKSVFGETQNFIVVDPIFSATPGEVSTAVRLTNFAGTPITIDFGSGNVKWLTIGAIATNHGTFRNIAMAAVLPMMFISKPMKPSVTENFAVGNDFLLSTKWNKTAAMSLSTFARSYLTIDVGSANVNATTNRDSIWGNLAIVVRHPTEASLLTTSNFAHFDISII